MKKYQEVEMKFRLVNVEHVLEILGHFGAVRSTKDEYQCDRYFVPPHRDFFEEDIVSEWLRLRKTDTEEVLNYKRWLPLGAKVQTHCEEYETVVSDGYAMQQIMKYLDFKEIIQVEKVRNCWKYQNILISIDEVTDLGTFIEMEYADKLEESEMDNALAYMEDVLRNKFEAIVEPRDRRGYPYQIMARKGLLES